MLALAIALDLRHHSTCRVGTGEIGRRGGGSSSIHRAAGTQEGQPRKRKALEFSRFMPSAPWGGKH